MPINSCTIKYKTYYYIFMYIYILFLMSSKNTRVYNIMKIISYIKQFHEQL